MRAFRIVALVCIVFVAACGGSGKSNSSPASPTPTPTVTNLAGVWTGSVSQTSATGGPECLAVFQSANGGRDTLTAIISQTGSSLTATATSQTSGQGCTYSGTVGTRTAALNMTSCNPQGYVYSCNGISRDVYLLVRSVTADIILAPTSSNLVGTTGDTYGVFVHGTTTNSIGSIIVTNDVLMSK